MANIIENYSRNNPAGIWRVYKYDLSVNRDVARFVAREQFAWPGGYELYVITDDGGVLCHDCCKTEYPCIAHSTPGDGWHVAAMDNAGNMDESVWCDHCGREIKSAYE